MRAMIVGVHTISYCNFTGSRFSRTNLCKATEKLKFVYDATSRFIRSNFHFFVLSQCCAYVLVWCQHTFHLVRVRKIACFVLQYLFWSPQIWLQMAWFPIKTSDYYHHKLCWKLSHVSLKISNGFHWKAIPHCNHWLGNLVTFNLNQISPSAYNLKVRY